MHKFAELKPLPKVSRTKRLGEYIYIIGVPIRFRFDDV